MKHKKKAAVVAKAISAATPVVTRPYCESDAIWGWQQVRRTVLAYGWCEHDAVTEVLQLLEDGSYNAELVSFQIDAAVAYMRGLLTVAGKDKKPRRKFEPTDGYWYIADPHTDRPTFWLHTECEEPIVKGRGTIVPQTSLETLRIVARWAGFRLCGRCHPRTQGGGYSDPRSSIPSFLYEDEAMSLFGGFYGL